MNDKKISELFDDLLKEKTFSLEAIEGIKKLKDTSEALQISYDKVYKELEASVRLVNTLRDDYKKIDEELSVWKNRSREIQQREKEITIIQKGWACAEARYDSYRTAFETVFRNRIIRETVQRSVGENGRNEDGTYWNSNNGPIETSRSKEIAEE